MLARTTLRYLIRLASAACLAGAAFVPGARAAEPLVGRVDGNTYLSASGLFKVDIPVSSAFGGTITDTKNEVSFQDSFTTYISIAVFPMDATQRWELSTRGLKDYLSYFFGNFVEPDFQRSFHKVEWEKTGLFEPLVAGGAFITYALLPGGSMFPSAELSVDPDRPPPTAKRGNLLFVRNGNLFVVSVELGERATEGSAYRLTAAEEDALLRQRLADAVDRISFPPAATAPGSAPLSPGVPR